jgi:uncharacterized alkaline shock family protein YloU
MSSATATWLPGPAGSDLTPDPPMQGRGETVITPKVVETIAARVAAATEGVAEVVPGSRLGGFLQIGGPPPASASAKVDQTSTEVQLTIHVAYPAPVFATAGRVRTNVVAELRRQTGLEPSRVDITVPKLVVDASRPRPRVR